jgi:hypothetical protein
LICRTRNCAFIASLDIMFTMRPDEYDACAPPEAPQRTADAFSAA